MPEITERSVVSCFLFKGSQVALFKRSSAVRTYPGKWAPISGSIESTDASPLATAYREISEETGLSASSIRFWRHGKPFSFFDAEFSREWTIYPFAFTLISDDITLDWEHETYAWYNPRDISVACVPRLDESLRAVYFEVDEAGTVLANGLRALQNDHDSGARVLASNAVRILMDYIDASGRDAVSAAWHLWKNGRESMGAAILNAMLHCLELRERNTPLQSYLTSRDANTAISSAFTAYLPQKATILTLSHSSTIAQCLCAAAATAEIDLRILESRPLFEGVALAEKVSSGQEQKKSLNVTVYTDASAAIAAKGADIVLLGADIIDGKGNVSNKTGSLPAVLAAKHVSSAKIVVVADTDKVTPFPVGHESNDPSEITRAWGRDIAASVENVYFEWVGSDLIDVYITELGIIKTADIPKLAAGVEEKTGHYFGR